ncbi:MAG TPA: DUF2442 domain-containing protein [Gemmatimonadaceae bacterium]
MKASQGAVSSLDVELVTVSPEGFTLSLGDREVFVDFELFPWFREATIDEIANVTRPDPDRLHWERLDVDLSIDAIEHSEHSPL